ncbi:MAG: LON peptidase substrate-binding domain-containing protein, partial [Rhabdaerophilum sp.]
MPSNAVYAGAGDFPQTLALFPLPSALLLPRGQIPLNIFEPRYIAMIDAALGGSRLIGMIQPDATHVDRIGLPALYNVGCAGRITQF